MAWERLSPLLAARRSMRLWNPAHRRFRDRAQPLTQRLPEFPAALPLYRRRRTRLLALDFDAKHLGPTAVTEDVDRCLAWISECGGRAITDRSSSGGQHILIPLSVGMAVPKAQIEPIVRLLAARLPTLDITPMLGDVSGCITPPGSACKEGGYRTLSGSLDAAVDALTVRSDSSFLARLMMLLSGGRIARARTAAHDTARVALSPRAPRTRTPSAPVAADLMWDGTGDQARLRTEHRRWSSMSAVVTAFAVHGAAPTDQRWRAQDGRLDRSAARQSVLTAAILQGMSRADVQAQLPAAGGSWAGLARSYSRYETAADAAMARDWDKACRWVAQHGREFRSSVHKTQERTGGCRGENATAYTRTHARWLAAAIAWVDTQWPGSPRRANALAVLQAMAYAAAVGGEVVKGVPVVELGGRSVSLMAGSLPETTVWEVLHEVREVPGAPLLRIRRAAGVLADRYALVTPQTNGRRLRPTRTQADLARVEPVHPAWSVLGIRHRRLWEAVVHQGCTTPADAFATARLTRSTGYTSLAALATSGLIVHTHGTVVPGPTTLDSIAHAHALHHAHNERTARHRRERALWKAWLAHRDRYEHADPWQTHETEDYLAAVVAAGPPTPPTQALIRRQIGVSPQTLDFSTRVPPQSVKPTTPRPESLDLQGPAGRHLPGPHPCKARSPGDQRLRQVDCARCAHAEQECTHVVLAPGDVPP
ncbi:hypothetical protein [Nocardia alni]|uniref:hypothetical protein n=1 Tax=Nocardia alni TaxID=2815723 RepID=UPI001C250261|nr:hypothetical protein [Nocardia alni]